MELQLVRKLNHGLLLSWPEGSLLGPSVGLNSGSLRGLLPGCFAYSRRGLSEALLLCTRFLCLFGSEYLFYLGQVVEFIFVGKTDVRAESQPHCEFGELGFLQPIRD
jgi:hypothetical protein